MSRNKLAMVCFVTTILFVGGLIIPYLNIAALLVISYAFISSNKEDMLCVLSYVISFSPIFKIDLNGFALFNLVLLFSIITLIYKSKGRLSKKKTIPVVVFGVYALITGFGGDMTNVIAVVLSMLLGAMLLSQIDYPYDLRKIANYLTCGIIASSVLAIEKGLFPRLDAYLVSTARIKLASMRYFLRFSGLSGNPNGYTMAISVVLAVYFVFVVLKRSKITDYIAITILSALGLLSVSKSFILAYAFLFFVVELDLLLHNPKRAVRLLLIIVTLIAVLYVFMDAEVIETIMYRLTNDTGSDATLASVTTGRTEKWSSYVQYISNDIIALFIGKGLGATLIDGHASHNFFLEMIYYLGIVGSVLYVYAVCKVYYSPRNHQGRFMRIVCYTPFAVLMIRGLARNMILSDQLVIYYMLCGLSLRLSGNETKKGITA